MDLNVLICVLKVKYEPQAALVVLVCTGICCVSSLIGGANMLRFQRCEQRFPQSSRCAIAHVKSVSDTSPVPAFFFTGSHWRTWGWLPLPGACVRGWLWGNCPVSTYSPEVGSSLMTSVHRSHKSLFNQSLLASRADDLLRGPVKILIHL